MKTRIARTLLVGGMLALVAACASDPAPAPRVSSGTMHEHVQEACERFDVPEEWVWAVMQQESGKQTHLNGKPIVSSAGAMGLMQVMPGTYRELRQQYSDLGPDPHHPRDNIHAGVAYLRKMYDLYGSPGFLAAYNCGPGCYRSYLKGNRTLPRETRNYLAILAPQVAGIHPERRHGSDEAAPVQMAEARHAAVRELQREVKEVTTAGRPTVPTSGRVGGVPPVGGRSATAQPAAARPAPVSGPSHGPRIQMAASSLPRPTVTPVATTPVATPPATGTTRYVLVPEGPTGQPDGDWGVQIGAFSSRQAGLAALNRAQSAGAGYLAGSRQRVQTVRTVTGKDLFRAQFVGLTSEAATQACVNLARHGIGCVRVAPNSTAGI